MSKKTTKKTNTTRGADKVRKPSKYELLVYSEERINSHKNTLVIESRQRVLEFELQEVEQSIVALSGALANMREQKGALVARLAGVASVIERRR